MPPNTVREVPLRRCAGCLAPIVRVHTTGPLPSFCPRCRVFFRDRQRLRSYLRSSLRLADALGFEAVAERTMAALAALEGAPA